MDDLKQLNDDLLKYDAVFLGSMMYGSLFDQGKILSYRPDDLCRLFKLAGEPVPTAIENHTDLSIDYAVNDVAALVEKAKIRLEIIPK